MRTQSADTPADVEAIQIALLRDADGPRRAALMRSLSQMTMQLSRQAIAHAYPELDEQEVLLEFVSLHYGEDLSNRVRAYLIEKNIKIPKQEVDEISAK